VKKLAEHEQEIICGLSGSKGIEGDDTWRRHFLDIAIPLPFLSG
jgi:hypothetical protein